MVFKFDNGQNVEMNTLLEGYDFKFIDDLQNVKDKNGTLHLGNPGTEIQKDGRSLSSVEIIFD